MSGPKRSLAARLISLAGMAVLIGTALARTKVAATRPGLAAVPATSPRTAAETPASPVPELVTYAVGYGLALLLTAAAFATVYWRLTEPVTAFGIVLGLGFVQMLVHFRCFLHVGFDKSSRDDLQLILFSILIILLMVGGTLVVLFNLRMRMM